MKDRNTQLSFKECFSQNKHSILDLSVLKGEQQNSYNLWGWELSFIALPCSENHGFSKTLFLWSIATSSTCCLLTIPDCSRSVTACLFFPIGFNNVTSAMLILLKKTSVRLLISEVPKSHSKITKNYWLSHCSLEDLPAHPEVENWWLAICISLLFTSPVRIRSPLKFRLPNTCKYLYINP